MFVYIFLMHDMLLYRNSSSNCGISFILVLQPLCWVWISLPNAVKTLAMDFNFDVAHDTGLLKSQIYLYMHPTCIETILDYSFKEILCLTLAMQWPLLKVTEISIYIEIPCQFWNSVNAINKILLMIISETRYVDIFDGKWGWNRQVSLILKGLVIYHKLCLGDHQYIQQNEIWWDQNWFVIKTKKWHGTQVQHMVRWLNCAIFNFFGTLISHSGPSQLHLCNWSKPC